MTTPLPSRCLPVATVLVVLSVLASPLSARADLLVTTLADRAPVPAAHGPPRLRGTGPRGALTAYHPRGDGAGGQAAPEDRAEPKRPATASLLPALQAFALILAIPGRDVGPPVPARPAVDEPAVKKVDPTAISPVLRPPPVQFQPPPGAPGDFGPTPVFRPQLVPEPATLLMGLVGSGMAGLLALARRRRAGAREGGAAADGLFRRCSPVTP
jgi:hypothetical protein